MAKDQLPPLLPLRVLEACARHESFSRAADELKVTPGAVTQQIRAIEAWAGAPLFRRTGRKVLLTNATKAALPSLREGFDRLSEAAQLLRSPARKTRVISLSAPPSFASKWLLPRLDRFRALYPDTEVWVSADTNLVDFNTTDVDVAIRYGAGAYEGLIAEKLLGEAVLPLASPDFIAKHGPFNKVSDLLRAPLLHDLNVENDPSCPDWGMWLKARGAQEVSLRGPRFNQSSMVIEQAVAGAGVALAKQTIAVDDLEAGRLAPVFDDQTPLAFAYWLVWPRGRTLLPPVRAFLAWVKAETLGEAIDGAGI